MSKNRINNLLETPEVGLEPFVAKFLLDRLLELGELKKFLQHQEFESIRQMAHNWKGFCKAYGFGPLGAMSVRLETLAAEGNWSQCEREISKMESYLTSASKEL